MKRLLCFALIGLLAGCMPPPKTITLQSTFDAAQARALLADGKNTIRGSALLRRRDGGVVTCAGREVHLTPVTAYSTERAYAVYGSALRGINPVGYDMKRFIFTNDSDLYQQLKRNTICDAQGAFKFEKVSDGEFFVSTPVIWTAGNADQGGVLMQRVIVSGGEIKEIVLTQ